MKVKTIAVVGSYAPSLINFRGELIRALVNQGMHVLAMAPDIDENTASALRAIGAEPVEYDLQRTGMNPFADFAAFSSLYKVFRRRRPSRVLAYTIKPVIYGSLAARLAGVPGINVMITGLGYAFVGKGWKQGLVSKLSSLLYRMALAGCRKVLFQNPDDRSLFVDRHLVHEDKTVLIHGSGVDIDYFSPVLLPSAPRFLMIARLLREKGVYEYVEAARLVRRQYPEVQFDLAGWLDDAPSSVRQDQLDEWIKGGLICFLGKLDDVRPAIANVAVYVLPSYREGTPRTVLEAMSMGRAVITSDAPGCRETVMHGESGLLVAVQDSQGLAGAMLDLIEHPERIVSMGKASRRLAEEKYDVHKVNQSILVAMELS